MANTLAESLSETGTMYVFCTCYEVNSNFASFNRDITDILSLPDELLAQILRIVVELEMIDTSTKPALFRNCKYTLQSVCSRFRGVVIALLPFLWSDVSTTLVPGAVSAHVQRGHSCGLNVELDFRKRSTSPSIEQFLSAVIPHAHRWRRFSIWMDEETPPSQFQMLRSDISLPLLQHMEVRDENVLFSTQTEADGHFLNETYQFFTLWKMPLLQSISTTNLIPKCPLSNLTSLDITFGHLPFNRDMRPLLNFLCLSTALQTLSITINRVSVHTLEYRGTKVSSLKTLHIAIDTNFSSVQPFLLALRFPNLTELNISLEGAASTTMLERILFMSILVPLNGRYPFVTSFSLYILGEFPYFPLILVRLPVLRHFTLRTRYTNRVKGDLSCLLQLESLTLRECRDLPAEWLIDLLRTSRDPSLSTLRNISIFGCNTMEVSKEELECLVDKGTIHWREP